MHRKLHGLLLLAFLTSALTAFADEEPPPPPPPPPPPTEETGAAVEAPSSSSGGDWAIRGSEGLLDRGTTHVRHSMLSFFFGFPFGGSYGSYGYYGVFSVGLGARFYIPIVSEGFLPMLNDSFGIEFGADTGFVIGGYGYGLGFALTMPAVAARWNFHLFSRLEAYAKLGIGVGLFFGSYVVPYPVVIANVGVIFKLNKVVSLRAEIGSPAIKIGIGLAF